MHKPFEKIEQSKLKKSTSDVFTCPALCFLKSKVLIIVKTKGYVTGGFYEKILLSCNLKNFYITTYCKIVAYSKVVEYTLHIVKSGYQETKIVSRIALTFC
jgi:hypothetical protein